MADPFLGEIRLFAGNFAPLDWAFCDGQTLSITQYSALYSLIGISFGGDGRTNFCLPDLRGRVPIGQGHRPGLSARTVGDKSGAETVTLTANDLPVHSHTQTCLSTEGNSASPQGGIPALESTGVAVYAGGGNTAMSPSLSTGGGTAHDNMQPWLAMRYIICVNGIFPTRE